MAESKIFHILGNDRRRAIVTILAEHDGSVPVSDVADSIAAMESSASSVPNNLYKSVYVSLQQTHLPQLTEEQVIEYDQEAKTISPGPHFEEVERYIDSDDSRTDELIHVAILAISASGLALIAIADFGVPLLGAIDPVFVSVIALLCVAICSLYWLLW